MPNHGNGVCASWATVAPAVGTLQPCLCLVPWRPVSCDVCRVTFLDVCEAPLFGVAVGGLCNVACVAWLLGLTFLLRVCVCLRGFLLYFLIASACLIITSLCINTPWEWC